MKVKISTKKQEVTKPDPSLEDIDDIDSEVDDAWAEAVNRMMSEPEVESGVEKEEMEMCPNCQANLLDYEEIDDKCPECGHPLYYG